MEQPITAPFDGTVTAVSARSGDSVQGGHVLVELARQTVAN